MRRFFAGVGAAVRGLVRAPRSREVRRAYWLLVLAIFLLTLALGGGGFWALFAWTEGPAASGWARAGAWLLRIVGGLGVLVISPTLAVFISNLLFPLFAELPFMAGMRALDPARAATLAALPGLGFWEAFTINLGRLFWFAVLSLACLALGMLPLLGPPLALPLALGVTARSLGWELLDPYLSRLSLDRNQQKAYVRNHFPELFGFGLVAALVLAIPLLGPLFFGLLQAAAAELVVSVLERSTGPNSTDASSGRANRS